MKKLLTKKKNPTKQKQTRTHQKCVRNQNFRDFLKSKIRE